MKRVGLHNKREWTDRHRHGDPFFVKRICRARRNNGTREGGTASKRFQLWTRTRLLFRSINTQDGSLYCGVRFETSSNPLGCFRHLRLRVSYTLFLNLFGVRKQIGIVEREQNCVCCLRLFRHIHARLRRSTVFSKIAIRTRF